MPSRPRGNSALSCNARLRTSWWTIGAASPPWSARPGVCWKSTPNRAKTATAMNPPTPSTREMLFQRVWARKVMDLALARLRAEYALAGTSGLFDYLQSFLPDNTPICSRAEAAERLGMTAIALDTAFHRMKRRYKEFLRKEIAETLASPTKQEVEEELAALMRVF